MKRIIALIALVGFVGSSAFAGECASTAGKSCSKSKSVAGCPVSKAQQQAKGAAGSIKEHARASKAAVMVAAR